MSLMSYVNRYFDQLTEPMFQRDEMDREVFFPFGMGTRGRLVPDAATGRYLRTRMRQAWMVFFLGWIPLISLISTAIPNVWAFLAAIVLTVGLLLAYVAHLARGLAVSSRRMTVRNQAASILTRYTLRRLIVMAALGAGLTGLCALDLFVPQIARGQPAWFRPTMVIGMIFFAAITAMWVWYAILKWRRA